MFFKTRSVPVYEGFPISNRKREEGCARSFDCKDRGNWPEERGGLLSLSFGGLYLLIGIRYRSNSFIVRF